MLLTPLQINPSSCPQAAFPVRALSCLPNTADCTHQAATVSHMVLDKGTLSHSILAHPTSVLSGFWVCTFFLMSLWAWELNPELPMCLDKQHIPRIHPQLFGMMSGSQDRTKLRTPQVWGRVWESVPTYLPRRQVPTGTCLSHLKSLTRYLLPKVHFPSVQNSLLQYRALSTACC